MVWTTIFKLKLRAASAKVASFGSMLLENTHCVWLQMEEEKRK